jgi:hypothetical protein
MSHTPLIQMSNNLEYGALGKMENPENRVIEANDLSENRGSNDWKNMEVSNGNHEEKKEESSLTVKLAVNASWVVNIFLLGAKIFAVAVSSSKAVTASLADSAVDIASQAVLGLADYYITRHSPNYPVGRSRLEALSVIGCAFIMSMASVEGKLNIETINVR